MTSAADYATFEGRVLPIVAGDGKAAIGRHDVAKVNPPTSAVPEYCGTANSDPATAAAAARGNKVIMAPATKAYLDTKYTADTKLGQGPEADGAGHQLLRIAAGPVGAGHTTWRRPISVARSAGLRHRGAVLIRRETPADAPVIRAVTRAAFTTPDTPPGGPAEEPFVAALRADASWLPALSVVATDGAEVVGHVMCSRARVGETGVVALGPISVRPDRQRAGVGSALMHAVLGAADALGEPLVALIGNPAFYHRFGFVLGVELAITPPVPDWVSVFQVRALAAFPAGLRGAFAYPPPFDAV